MKQVTQLREHGLFDARAPRYTSYPPANHFTSTDIAALAQGWISAIPAGSKISLYVHVPFCRRLCWFCACRTQGTKSLDPVRIYVETLLQELRQLRTALPEGIRLSRLHWGGGTPTLLPPDLIEGLADSILDAFPLAERAEFSVEIDPTEIDGPRMAALARAGMTRASIGIQDFDPDIQAAIGRPQSFQSTAEAVAMIRDHGIAGLNADILFGLPRQDRTRMSETAQKLLALSPDRVALFGYAHVPWMSKRQVMIPEKELPDPRARLALFETARELFLADGFDEIGIDHFARSDDGLARACRRGRLRRNFQGYTDDQSPILLGLGASSISRFPQGYAQNAPATGAYTARIRAAELPMTRGHAFSDEDRWRGRMIESLMCHFQIDNQEMIRDFGISPSQLSYLFEPVRAKFGPMVRVTPDAFQITSEGRPLTRIIAQQFDTYMSGPDSHSRAI